MSATKAAVTADVLVCVDRGQSSLDGITSPECHALVYFAKLISMYSGEGVGWWGYSFDVTRSGSPYSPDLESTIDWALTTGLLVRRGIRLALSQRGHEALAQTQMLQEVPRRVPFIHAALSACLVLPLPLVIESLCSDPAGVTNSRQEPRELLSDLRATAKHSELDALAEVIGDPERKSLLQAAAVYASYRTAMSSGTAA